MAVFVDTVAWIALANIRDSLHIAARETFGELTDRKTPLLTSEFVHIEVGNALSSVQFRPRTASFLTQLRHSPSIEIVPATSDLFERGLELFGTRDDKDWGLVDCTSFVIMTDRTITEAFTEDHHFEQAGFSILL